jgi:hypothetical protein
MTPQPPVEAAFGRRQASQQRQQSLTNLGATLAKEGLGADVWDGDFYGDNPSRCWASGSLTQFHLDTNRQATLKNARHAKVK